MVITVFRSRVKPELREEYGRWVLRMSDLARTMPGYISHKGYTAEDGERCTIVEFETPEAQRAWAMHPEHVEAKKKGREQFYLEYRLQICTLERQTEHPKR